MSCHFKFCFFTNLPQFRLLKTLSKQSCLTCSAYHYISRCKIRFISCLILKIGINACSDENSSFWIITESWDTETLRRWPIIAQKKSLKNYCCSFCDFDLTGKEKRAQSDDIQFDKQLYDPVNQACNLKLELFIFQNEMMLARLLIESGGKETLSGSLIYIQNKTLEKLPVWSKCMLYNYIRNIF